MTSVKPTVRFLPTVAYAWGTGFRHLGRISDDGIPAESDNDGDIPAFGGRTIRTVQSGHATITITVDRTLIADLLGPLYALAWDARRIDPHWYLRGDE